MDHNSKLSYIATSSMFGGFCSGYLINIFEVIKTQLLTQAIVTEVPGNKSSSFGIFHSIIRSEGLGSLFRGSFYTCITNMTRAPLSMVVYEYSKLL